MWTFGLCCWIGGFIGQKFLVERKALCYGLWILSVRSFRAGSWFSSVYSLQWWFVLVGWESDGKCPWIQIGWEPALCEVATEFFRTGLVSFLLLLCSVCTMKCIARFHMAVFKISVLSLICFVMVKFPQLISFDGTTQVKQKCKSYFIRLRGWHLRRSLWVKRACWLFLVLPQSLTYGSFIVRMVTKLYNNNNYG